MRSQLSVHLLLALILVPLVEPAGARTEGGSAWTRFPLGDRHLTGEHTVDGALVVLPGSRLVLEDATLLFAGSPVAPASLRVLPGGELLARRVTLQPLNASSPPFGVDLAGRAVLEDCEIRGARAVHFSGPATRGSRIERCDVVGGAQDGIVASDAAEVAILRNRVLDTKRADLASPSVAIRLFGVRDVRVEGNFVERGEGDALIDLSASIVLAQVQGGPRVRHNVLHDPTGLVALSVEGGTPWTLLEGNAIATSGVGVNVYGETGVITRLHTIEGVRGPSSPIDPVAGLRASGAFQPRPGRHYDPRFEENRVDGFRWGALAEDGGHPLFRRNAFLPGNDVAALGRYTGHGPYDLRWNHFGGRPVEGDVLAEPALAAPPPDARPLVARAGLVEGGLAITLSNRGCEGDLVEVFVRNLVGAADFEVRVPAGGSVELLVPGGAPTGPPVVLARGAGCATVAVAR